ncbi:MAG: relaxase domain-containing protein, partial [Proteobacteria bacterium]|nr:relaxase domain-containing protein [Pseudomonadota bacterium]
MISVSRISSSAGAANYYTTQDYYSEGGEVAGRWAGSGAQELGLVGEPDKQQFREVLEGKLGGDVGIQLGPNGKHHAGWDFTFAPDKSVSVAGLVLGDERVIAAHTAAVAAAVERIDKEYAFARVRDAGGVRLEKSNGIIAATWTHESSRGQDPQLHTHVTIANATQTRDGQWRALETQPLYRARALLDVAYKAELGAKLQHLGYKIEVDRSTGNFRLAAIPEKVAEAFSTRAKEIEAALVEKGLGREEASAQLRGAIAKATRDDKQHIGPAELRAQWRETAAGAGLDGAKGARIVSEARERADDQKWRAEHGTSPAYAEQVLKRAAEKLGERESVFGRERLTREAQQLGLGRCTMDQIERAAVQAVTRGELLPRDGGQAYTTPGAIQTERATLAIEFAGRGASAALLNRIEAQKAVARTEMAAAMQGRAWNADQRNATVGVLSSTNRIIGVQGLAGTAKTSTVLATVAAAARTQGYEIRAIAPTAAAAQELGAATQAEGVTLASHLGQVRRELTGKEAGDAQPQGRQVWVLDEASLASAKDMRDLLRAAETQDAKVILAGDTQQLGSVEAGRAFDQLQRAGMETHRLDTIVRQTNETLRAAVNDAQTGNWRAAMNKIEAAGGKVREVA